MCCVDKDGILALPNPNAEKVFFFRKKKERRHKKPTKISQVPVDDEGRDFFTSNIVDDEEELNISPDVHSKSPEDDVETRREEVEVSSSHFSSKGSLTCRHLGTYATLYRKVSG